MPEADRVLAVAEQRRAAHATQLPGRAQQRLQAREHGGAHAPDRRHRDAGQHRGGGVPAQRAASGTAPACA